MAHPRLEVMHSTAQRVRLRYPDTCADDDLETLIHALAAQPWLNVLHLRPLTRSLVIELQPGCSPMRWRIGLAALGYPLTDPAPIQASSAAPIAAAATEPVWERMTRQIGGNIIGAALGQVLLGGAAGLLGVWWLGPRAGVLLGACGAVVGSVIGSVAGGELADGESPLRKGDLGAVTLRKLGGRLGEEAGWTSGGLIGAALAGPVGAVAGMTVGSVLAGQAVEDLLKNHGRLQGIGRTSWLVRLGEDQAGERITESLMGGLGRGLSGGQEWGAQLGTRLGGSVGRKIDWAGSWSRRQLISRLQPRTVAPAS